MALLSGIALSLEALGRYGRLSKNRDPVSVLRVRTSWLLASLPLSSSRFCPLVPYYHFTSPAGTLLPHPPYRPSVPIASGIPSSSDGFSPITRDHMREPVISPWVTGRRTPQLAGTFTAEWLSSLGGSPRLYPLPRFTLRSHSQ